METKKSEATLRKEQRKRELKRLVRKYDLMYSPPPPAYLVELGKSLREKRKSKGLTSTRLSELSGVTTSNILNYENARLEPKLSTLQKLAQALNCSLSVDIVRKKAANGGIEGI